MFKLPEWLPHLAGYNRARAIWMWLGLVVNWSAIEKRILTICALLALFPLYQYVSEAEDRKRERLVLESQLSANCFSENLLDQLEGVRDRIVSSNLQTLDQPTSDYLFRGPTMGLLLHCLEVFSHRRFKDTKEAYDFLTRFEHWQPQFPRMDDFGN